MREPLLPVDQKPPEGGIPNGARQQHFGFGPIAWAPSPRFNDGIPALVRQDARLARGELNAEPAFATTTTYLRTWLTITS
jgi:hypothetical protein